MNSKEYKQKLLNKLYEPYLQCLACPLGYLGRRKVVFGSGNPDADIIIIGEAPGKEEDLLGEPFVGKSGKFLNKTLENIGLSKDNIFITNIVKCRPPNNRQPSNYELKTCKQILLLNQIKIINPKLICTLGSFALNGLLEKSYQITKIRGSTLFFDNIRIIPTYHPAYVLRNISKKEIWIDDLKSIQKYI